MSLYSEQTPGGTSHQITSLQLCNNVLYGAAGISQFFEAILYHLMFCYCLFTGNCYNQEQNECSDKPVGTDDLIHNCFKKRLLQEGCGLVL